MSAISPFPQLFISSKLLFSRRNTTIFTLKDTLNSAMQDGSQYITQFNEYPNGYEEEDIAQYKNGLIISED